MRKMRITAYDIISDSPVVNAKRDSAYRSGFVHGMRHTRAGLILSPEGTPPKHHGYSGYWWNGFDRGANYYRWMHP